MRMRALAAPVFIIFLRSTTDRNVLKNRQIRKIKNKDVAKIIDFPL
jgi:hypothetical protein